MTSVFEMFGIYDKNGMLGRQKAVDHFEAVTEWARRERDGDEDGLHAIKMNGLELEPLGKGC